MATPIPALSRAHRASVDRFRAHLSAHGDPVVRDGSAKYFKHVLPFLGLRAPQVKAHFNDWYHCSSSGLMCEDKWKENFLDESASVQKAVGYELLRRQESECKAAGVAALESVVMAGQLLVDDLAPVAAIFDEGRAHLLSISTTVLRQIRSIKDWGTADSLSTRVLRRLVQRDVTAANVLISWRNAKNQWRVRAGLVSFVVLAKHGDKNYPNFISSLLPPIEAGLKWEERFVQLAAGWLLRELYLADSKRIVAFIELHIHRFSAEGLRYAVEKMKDPLRGRLIDLRRQTLREGKRPADTPLEEEDFADSEAAEKKGKTYMRRSKRRKATIEKDV